MAKIDNPLVFISYAWTSSEYEEKVVNFVERLRSYGIEVLFDKYEMLPGKEVINFMEKSVKDPRVTNVLMLLNPSYAEKADNRVGGVGTETQIISSKIYKDTEQTKFIPVVFDTDNKDISESKPVFLDTIIYVDLSDKVNYEDNFRDLVKILHGVTKYVKGPLGTKPDWVNEPEVVSEVTHKTRVLAEKKRILDSNLTKETLKRITEDFVNDLINSTDISWHSEELHKTLIYYRKYRNDYIEIINNSIAQENINNLAHEGLENIKISANEKLTDNHTSKLDFVNLFIHELFIYVTAIFLKQDNYDGLGKFLRKPYISFEYGYLSNNFVTFDDFAFTHNKYNKFLEDYTNERDNTKYISGKSQFLIEGIHSMFQKHEIVFSDLLLSSLSLIYYPLNRPWFPILYIYSDKNSIFLLKKIAISLKSPSRAEQYFCLLGVSNEKDLKIAFEKGYEKYNNLEYPLGYNRAFNSANVIFNYVKPDDICSNEL